MTRGNARNMRETLGDGKIQENIRGKNPWFIDLICLFAQSKATENVFKMQYERELKVSAEALSLGLQKTGEFKHLVFRAG